MFISEGAVVLSASDLTAATTCEWAVLRRLDAKLGRVDAVPEPEDAMNRRAAALGDRHEARQLAAYQQELGAGVVVIDRPDTRDPDALRAAQERTLAAMRDGAGVVFQATLFDGRFLGFADFLVRSGDEWEVVDTKLARRAKVTALLQVAAYATALRALGVAVGERVHLLLGDGTTSTHRLADVVPVHAERMARLRGLVEERVAAAGPIAWGAEGVAACGRCAECTAQVEATRDVLLVGRLTVRQRDRLRAVGVRTIDELAASSGPVEGIGAAPLQRLRLQAELQLAAERRGGAGVEAQVIDAEGLAALPEPDPGDVFFDFEGDPLWSADGRTWGLEYLFGVVELDDAGRERYRPFWAHDREQEKQALLDFLAYLQERRRAHPGLHVYHYADYERSHLQQLCARHGVGEAVLDELLREHVLVDLYPVVLRSLRISERSYGLKRLEPLYMGDRLRESDVTNGADSVTAYVTWGGLVEQGRTAEAEALLAEIADYNAYDCASTRGLRDWLLGLADDRGVGRRPPLPGDPEADAGLVRREVAATAALLAHVADVPRDDRTPAQTALALAAAAIEYHRREDKAFWWEHYDREIAAVDDWADQKDVLVVDDAEVLTDWHREGGQRTDRRLLRLVGQLAAGSGLRRGSRTYVMYDGPGPEGCDPVPAGQRGEHEHGEVRDVETLPDGRTAVVVEERVPSEGCATWSALPFALTPGRPLATPTQRSAILEWGERLALGPDRRDAVLDLLRREPPHLLPGGALESPAAPTADAVVRDLLRLDGSYLAVQGPPGTGKTRLGAEVITALVRDHGWRVGVVAQSHAVVENLLDRVVAAGLDAQLVKKKVSSAGTVGAWTRFQPETTAAVLLFVMQRRGRGGVLGGTAWTFSNARQVPRQELDLLVLDEAGQFSIANTIAVGVAARNLLLLGDPQQLPQVSQGLHPEPVDASALGWLAQDHDVLPAEFGVFLPETWRMHPDLTAAVSDLSYEGRLAARLPETAARRLTGLRPGLHAVPVEHAGDTVESAAEADVVVRLVRDAVGRAWTDPARDRFDDPLDQDDVIVVAPFNAQVGRIRAALDDAGLRRVRVGTVDRFQGQEAVVAVVSLTASSPADVPRGIGFVLSRNRINVAISRAQWAAHLVHSPALADALPHDAVGVADLSGFLRLLGRA
ncbi:TM0106 family RecB-like putative nuclease [Amnibacterium setariae]|uniref:TM0106 family RecB-like putative nuclease n=1 Tax=Amnibacterium setariae TaxID=2306585 RepID=A0A3A1TUG7_9MICO|nr:bifunctional RecB family nuclease/DEAD/DEAH box helicase [Amnibacterium setariae]RIX27903.1 TM0106 family RecB-like putative nuclease [Amnibacterium setariae]